MRKIIILIGLFLLLMSQIMAQNTKSDPIKFRAKSVALYENGEWGEPASSSVLLILGGSSLDIYTFEGEKREFHYVSKNFDIVEKDDYTDMVIKAISPNNTQCTIEVTSYKDSDEKQIYVHFNFGMAYCFDVEQI
jgi:hypothetical protein